MMLPQDFKAAHKSLLFFALRLKITLLKTTLPVSSDIPAFILAAGENLGAILLAASEKRRDW